MYYFRIDIKVLSFKTMVKRTITLFKRVFLPLSNTVFPYKKLTPAKARLQGLKN